MKHSSKRHWKAHFWPVGCCMGCTWSQNPIVRRTSTANTQARTWSVPALFRTLGCIACKPLPKVHLRIWPVWTRALVQRSYTWIGLWEYSVVSACIFVATADALLRVVALSGAISDSTMPKSYMHQRWSWARPRRVCILLHCILFALMLVHSHPFEIEIIAPLCLHFLFQSFSFGMHHHDSFSTLHLTTPSL